MNTNPTIREELKKDGYSVEEKYFYELNQDLIQKQRIQLDLIRQSQERMKCPKCGAKLEESTVEGLHLDQCTQCHGVFMREEDAKSLIHEKKAHRFMKGLKKLFKPVDDYHLF